MKQHEFKPCLGCGRGTMHNGDLAFLRINLEYLIANPRAIRRQAGLEMQIGGPLASAMGPDEEMADTVSKHRDLLVCLPCAMRPEALFHLLEKASEAEEGAEREATLGEGSQS